MRGRWAAGPGLHSTIGSVTPSLLSGAAGANETGHAARGTKAQVLGQLIGEHLLHSLHLDPVAKLALEAGDVLVADAARNHLGEPAQVGVDVQCQTVGRHTSPYAHTNRGQLALTADPDPGQTIGALRLHAELRCGPDDGGFEGADVTPQV